MYILEPSVKPGYYDLKSCIYIECIGFVRLDVAGLNLLLLVEGTLALASHKMKHGLKELTLQTKNSRQPHLI